MISAEAPAVAPVGPKPGAGAIKHELSSSSPPPMTAAAAVPPEGATPTKGKKHPPIISTEEDDNAKSSGSKAAGTEDSRSAFRQAQTPKHCNKNKAGGDGGANNAVGHGPHGVGPAMTGPPPSGHQWAPAGHHHQQWYPHPHHHSHAGAGYYGQQQQQHARYGPQGQQMPPHYGAGGPPPPHTPNPHMPPYNYKAGGPPLPQTVSPGSYRPGSVGSGSGSASWEQQQQHVASFQHRQQRAHPGYPHPPMGYPPVAPALGLQGRSHPSHVPHQFYHQQQKQQQQQTDQDTAAFSRAVSSSFENLRSKGSNDGDSKDDGSSGGTNKPAALSRDLHAYKTAQQQQEKAAAANSDEASADSWGMLHQVQSVDEAQMKAANEAKQKTAKANKEEAKEGSKTPTDQIEKGRAVSALSHLSKSPGSLLASDTDKLDALSCVASVQEHLDTSGTDAPDLLQCGSGSSGSLGLFATLATSTSRHARRNSLDHPIAPDDLIGAGSKRNREERGDDEGKRSDDLGEIRTRPTKKGKADPIVKASNSMGDKDAELLDKGKATPLSISCTPPGSPVSKVKQAPVGAEITASSSIGSAIGGPKLAYLTASPGMPNYSFSIDSMPSFSKEAGKLPNYGVGLPPRPASASSGSLGLGLPMQKAGTGSHDEIPPSMPSWEINGQDSFVGNMSVGSGASGEHGTGLFSSFSFTNDYHMLTQAGLVQGPQGSNDAKREDQVGNFAKKKDGRPHQHPSIDSRNQPLPEGGGGLISRTGTFESAYTASSIPTAQSWQSPGANQYPPHAPSWSSASSGMSYAPHMQGYGPPNRSMYSPQVPPNAYLPPSAEFRVPPQGQIGKGPPPPVYLMPSGPHSAGPPRLGMGHPSMMMAPKPYIKGPTGSVFNWTKGDDSKLVEVMKKYKNPRDWEPVSREHARGKTAKECHDRWVRYLKPGVRKGQWTDQEDAIVVDAVSTSAEQPFTRWSDLASKLPGRVGKQIRDRWVNHLNPNINHMPFSREDDLLLWNGNKEFGKRWVEISTKLFNSSRSENHIKNRWYSASFKKFIANEFGSDAYAATAIKPATKSKAKA
mmetsp:Transcript_11020/g.25921  ORF Transcript_11020/g.25921 Transcript_11020/m.25921 type:complete len:1068 (+) Transcript_11020:132-3335(+)